MDSNKVGTFLKDQQSVIRKMIRDRDFPYLEFEDFFPQTINKEQHDIDEDVKRLDQIYDCIEIYESNKSKLRDTLITISNLITLISFNDCGDKESHYIRNRYGYIRRNKNKSINTKGIYFENLSHLKIILSDNHNYLSIPETEINNLQTDLPCLKQKIAHILSQHNSSTHYQNLNADINIDFSISIAKITNFSKKYYEQVILLRINNELIDLENIDFKIVNDRYYFARVFTILGELLNEWLDQSQKENTMLKTTFRKITKLRNLIIHYHGSIKVGLDERNQSITEIINELKIHLKQVIVNNKNCGVEWEINFAYEESKEFCDMVDRLLNIFTSKNTNTRSEIENIDKEQNQNNINTRKLKTNEDTKHRLNRLLSRACGIIDGTMPGVKLQSSGKRKINSIEDQLEFLNDNYQEVLSHLDESDRKIYPNALDLSNKDMMRIFCGHIVPKQSPVQSSNVSDKFINKVDSKVRIMKEEIDYFIFLKKGSLNYKMDKSSKKFRYIFQHSMLVIGQFVRDIENFNICNHSFSRSSSQTESENISKFSVFKLFSSSSLISQGKVTSKQLRNQGLAHNVLCFDEENFFKSLNEIQYLSNTFHMFYHLFWNDNLSPVPASFVFLGTCFIIIHMYKDAIECFEKALDQLNGIPTGIYQTLLLEFDPDFNNVFQLDSSTFEIYYFSIAACFADQNFEKAFDKCEFVWKRIDMTKIDNISDRTSNYFCSINIDMIKLLDHQGKFTEAADILEKLESMNVNYHLKSVIVKHYVESNNYSKALELTTPFLSFPIESIDTFNIKLNHVQCLVNLFDEQKKCEIEKYLNELDHYLSMHCVKLKSKVHDNLLEQKLDIFILKIRFIITCIIQNSKPEEAIDNLKELSNQFKDVWKYSDKLTFEYLIERFYTVSFSFSNCFFCQCMYPIGIDIKQKEIVKEAQFYLFLTEEFTEKYSILSERRKEVVEWINKFSSYVADVRLSRDTLSKKERIDCLLGILNLFENRNLAKDSVLKEIGRAYQLMSYCDYKDGDVDEAVACIGNAIEYYALSLECLDKEKGFLDKIIANNISSIRLQIATCYFEKSMFQRDLMSMIECLLYCDDVLSSSSQNNLRKDVLVIRCDTVNNLSNINKALLQIMSSNLRQIDIPDNELELVSLYLKNKLDIELSNKISESILIYRCNLSINDHLNQIKNEIRISSREFILISKFYRVLQFNNLLKSA